MMYMYVRGGMYMYQYGTRTWGSYLYMFGSGLLEPSIWLPHFASARGPWHHLTMCTLFPVQQGIYRVPGGPAGVGMDRRRH